MSEKTFPTDDMDPAAKNEKYCREWAEAIYHNWMNAVPRTIFAHAASKYEVQKSYAYGYQDSAKYKKGMGTDEQAESTWLNIDWSIRPILSKFRRIALGMLQKSEYNVNFMPVDPLARDEVTTYFNEQKAKIMMRDKLLQQMPELAESPSFMRKFGEAEDIEELQMQMDFGAKTNLSIEAEEGVQVVLQDEDNDINEHRKLHFENYFDHGISGQKVWIDDNGRVRFRTTVLGNIFTNFCNRRDFKDLHYVGEVIAVPLTFLATKFNKEKMEELTGVAQDLRGQQPSGGGEFLLDRQHDPSKLFVLDCEWKTTNSLVRRQAVNSEGNVVFKDAKYKNLKSEEKVTIDGEEKKKYVSKKVEVVYTCKWIVGTEHCYDFGIAKDQPRSTEAKKASRTELSYTFYAPDFHKMRAQGILEQLIPMADEYQLLNYKIQNLNNRMMPFGWAIDLDALEDVALGAGGKKLDPSEVLDMFFQSQVLAYRRKGEQMQNQNYKPIEVIQTSFGNDMVALYNHMASIINQIRDISGLNEMIDGSTGGKDRMPNPLIEANHESANNALFGIIDAEKVMLERLARTCFKKLQIALKAGDYGGYVKAIGSQSVKLITVAPRLALHEFAITCEARPTDEHKQMLYGQMEQAIAQELLDPADVLIIIDMYSTRKAYQLLAYRVKRNKAQKQQVAMQQQEMNGKVQMDSARAAAEEERKTLQFKHDLTMEEIREKNKGLFAVQDIKNEGSSNAAEVGAKAKIISQAMSTSAQEGGSGEAPMFSEEDGQGQMFEEEPEMAE